MEIDDQIFMIDVISDAYPTRSSLAIIHLPFSCAYLALKYSKNSKDSKGDELLQNCICLCDDDNDLEMAMACGKAFLPSISSETMKRAAQDYPNKIIICASNTTTATSTQLVKETKATEVALMAAIEEIKLK